MRFLADMCVNVHIARCLQEKGHDATHLRDEGLHRMPHMIDRVSVVIEESTEALEQSGVVVVEKSRHRVRYLPIGEREATTKRIS